MMNLMPRPYTARSLFPLTSVGQLTAAQTAAAARTQDLQRQVDTLSANVNDLQRRLASLPAKADPLGLIDNPQIVTLTRELQPKTAQLQALRSQLAQAQQAEAALRPTPTPIVFKTAPVTASSPTSEFATGNAATTGRPNYLVPALVVGAVALLAGGYFLTRPR